MKIKKLSEVNWTRCLGLSGVLLLALALHPVARAEEADPPGRVARISYVHGSVSMQPGGTGDWGSAEINRPMTIGDRLWTDSDARAELQAGAAAIHVDSKTALSFLNLDENAIQMRMAEGVINFRVRDLRDGELYELDTPNLAFTVKHAGAFRVDVNEAGDRTAITVLRGEGEVTAGGQTYTVHEGDRAEFEGTEDVRYQISSAPGPDNFDRWAQERDQRGEHSRSSQYVSRDVVGYEDLDEYGTWRDVPDYGPMWYPASVGVGWAPYSYGYWNWVGPWGWTWIDYSPWGFAPFHYGRWAFAGGGWGWCPGPRFGRSIYAPALVGFIGGRNFGVGFGFGGSVGWFPLGPREPFFPWYRHSSRYGRNVNITNTTIRNVNILNTHGSRGFNYAYARNANAVTATSQRSFANGEAVNRSRFRVTPDSLRHADVTTSASVTPTQRGRMGGPNSNVRVSRPPVGVENRSVFTRTAPAAGASHLPVRTMSGNRNMGGRGAGSAVNAPNRPMDSAMNRPMSGAMNSRQHELQNDKPRATASANEGRFANAPSRDRGANSPRTWSAQGNATDNGRAPSGFGRGTAAPNVGSNSPRSVQGDRPPWAGRSNGGVSGGGRSARPEGDARMGNSLGNSSPNDRPSRGQQSAPTNRDRVGNRGSSGRSYEPPPSSRGSSRPAPRYSDPARPSYSAPRSYSAPPRTYSAPRSYSAPSRTYSAPRSYSAPSRTYSAPSGSGRGSSGGQSGGGSRAGGGSSPSRGRR